MYTTPEELADLIADAQRTGKLSPRLVEVLDRLFGGVWSRFSRGIDRDDFVQACWVRFLTYLGRVRADQTQNVFRYLTSLARSVGILLWRDEVKQRHEALDAYVENTRVVTPTRRLRSDEKIPRQATGPPG